jgi:DNA-binding transcriptional regulator YdaS (Cro superfamily)
MAIEFLHEAIKRAGGQTALANALKPKYKFMRQGNIQKWLRSPNPEKMPPADYCPDIERLTGVRCEDMRPDVDWTYLRQTCKRMTDKAA